MVYRGKFKLQDVAVKIISEDIQKNITETELEDLKEECRLIMFEPKYLFLIKFLFF